MTWVRLEPNVVARINARIPVRDSAGATQSATAGRQSPADHVRTAHDDGPAAPVPAEDGVDVVVTAGNRRYDHLYLRKVRISANSPGRFG